MHHSGHVDPPAMRKTISRRGLIKAISAAAGVAAAPACMSLTREAAAQQTNAANGERTAPGGQMTVRNVYCNQLGYLPHARKLATIVLAGDAKTDPTDCPFAIYAIGSAQAALTGVLTPPALDAASSDLVRTADFSALLLPGRYRLQVLGVDGDPFLIDDAVYHDALRLTMRFFYGQRCGCRVDLGDGYKHRRCHTRALYSASSGRDGKLHNTGGWHDAGDYGRYVVNSAIACGTLLWAWEMFPDALETLELDLPESGGALPDPLAEVRWNLDWMLSMQDPADGGVWHKQTSTQFCSFVMPDKDHLPSEIIGTGAEPFKSTAATAGFAAVMAIAARCYRPLDQDFADRCLDAARRAYSWSAAHPDVLFKNPSGVVTGEYGDSNPGDDVLWAAAELFRTTREPAFEQDVLTAVEPSLPALRLRQPSWGNVRPLGLWAYMFASAMKPNAVTAGIMQATQRAAAELIARSKANGYGNTLAETEYDWGSNGEAANQSLLLLVADRLSPSEAAVEAALGNLHYLLGRNCFGVSWVTHVGLRPFAHPHHRPSGADRIAAPWPGMLAGGPNHRGGDQVADRLAQAAPMRMWVDDQQAYSLNEVAINWNAPLVFLLAGAVSAAAQHPVWSARRVAE